MEDTCRAEKCWFYLLIKDLSGDKPDVKDCPFYQEMMFTQTPVGGKVESAKLFRDCVNKRSLLILLEEVWPRLLGLQKSNEESRNTSKDLNDTVMTVLNIAMLKDGINIVPKKEVSDGTDIKLLDE
jgi:hypothetical protein